MSKVVFTMGSSTEQKMDMSLDSIIKQNKPKKGQQTRGAVKGGQKKPIKNAAAQRRQQMAAQVRDRAAAKRANKVDKMRGVQSTNQPTFKVKTSFTKDRNWVSQQRQRDKERKKKLQSYKGLKRPTGSASSSGNSNNNNTKNNNNNNTKKNNNDLSSFKISVPNPAFHFEAPSFQSNNNNNNNNRNGQSKRGNRGGKADGNIRISAGGNGRRAKVTDRPQRERDLPQRTVQFKGRKNEAVANRRGIVAAEDKQPASLNDRFGSVQTTQRGNNTNRGRGGRGGNGRGSNRGGRGGRNASFRVVRRS